MDKPRTTTFRYRTRSSCTTVCLEDTLPKRLIFAAVLFEFAKYEIEAETSALRTMIFGRHVHRQGIRLRCT